jgi:hypothetical protein
MKLKAGDIRQEGDVVRSILNEVVPGTLDDYGYLKRGKIYFGPWQPVLLIGWPILQSDLMHQEFFR